MKNNQNGIVRTLLFEGAAAVAANGCATGGNAAGPDGSVSVDEAAATTRSDHGNRT